MLRLHSYAIDAGASGIFTGQAGNLVERVAGAWVFRPMRNCSIIRDASNGAWFERSGADWLAYTFNDTAVAWAEVTDKPSEFPPSAHTHLISQVAGYIGGKRALAKLLIPKIARVPHELYCEPFMGMGPRCCAGSRDASS